MQGFAHQVPFSAPRLRCFSGRRKAIQRPVTHRAARTRQPDAVALDATIKLAAATVLLEEGVEGVEEGHFPSARAGQRWRGRTARGSTLSVRLNPDLKPDRDSGQEVVGVQRRVHALGADTEVALVVRRDGNMREAVLREYADAAVELPGEPRADVQAHLD